MIGYDQASWVARLGHRDDDPAGLLAWFEALRTANLGLWARFGDRGRPPRHAPRTRTEELPHDLTFRLAAGHDRIHLEAGAPRAGGRPGAGEVAPTEDTPRSPEGVVAELAPDGLRHPVERLAADQPRGVPGFRPTRREKASSPASLSARTPARTCLSRPVAARRAWRIAMASSASGAMVAPPPHGARTTNPPSDPCPRSSTRAASAEANAPSRCARSSPVAAASRAVMGPRSAGRKARIRGSAGSPSSPGASRIRYQVWTSNPSRSYIGRPASVATRTSVRQPLDSAASIVARVSSRPTPRRRHAGSTHTIPIQPAGPLRLATPVPTTTPSTSATNGRARSERVTNCRWSRRSPQSWRRNAAASGSTSAGVIGRIVGRGMSRIVSAGHDRVRRAPLTA